MAKTIPAQNSNLKFFLSARLVYPGYTNADFDPWQVGTRLNTLPPSIPILIIYTQLNGFKKLFLFNKSNHLFVHNSVFSSIPF